MHSLEDRYQFKPWYIKLWRRRYQLLIPYYTLLWYLNNKLNHENKYELSFYWSVAVGDSHLKMGWFHTSEELIASFSAHSKR